ncbi:MAG: hydroxyacylglutathione hydrolase [Thiohalomonadaceae bacterium]
MLNVDCIPAFDDNYVWALHTAPGRVALVDPGDADPVIGFLEAAGLTPEAILITHHHGDHTGGLAELTARWPVPVYGPVRRSFGQLSRAVRDGDEFLLGDVRLRVLETPGHTRDHVCYLAPGALFCGDTLFTAGCGRLFEGTPAQMHASLERIRALPDDTLVYCAHEYTLANLGFARVAEPDNAAIEARWREVQQARDSGLPTVPSTLALEKQTNPFLRSHEPALRAAVERFAGRPLSSGAEVFATVRYWKDTLD